MAEVLKIQSVCKRFGGIAAVDNVSLIAESGMIHGVIGQNGAGKTTLFNMIAGTIPVDSGRIVILDSDVTAAPDWRRSHMGVARTFQIPHPVWGLTVAENVQLALVSHGKSLAEARKQAVMHVRKCGLGAKLDESPSALSPGQLRLLELARASALDPKVLLLDEIFAGLSQSERKMTADMVVRLKESGIAIVWIEHNVQLMMELADKILVMDHGRPIAVGAPEEIVKDRNVISAYLGNRREKRGAHA